MQAIKKIPQAVIDNLIRPSSFELLATILRNHIALGELGAAEIGANEIIRFVGGFSIQFNASLGIETNPGVTQSEVPVHHQANMIKDSTGQPIRLQASNGAVFKIDSVLDEFVSYFGVDATGMYSSPPAIVKQSGTMATVLKTEPDLSELNSLYEKIYPDFLTRLSLGSGMPAIDETTVYLAPTNKAFDILPTPSREKSVEPSNFGATSFLLGHGLGTYDQKAQVVRSVDGFNISIKGDRASNARIEKRICAQNGCVWLIGRWLDPIFL